MSLRIPPWRWLQLDGVGQPALSTWLLEWEWLVLSVTVAGSYLLARLVHWLGKRYLPPLEKDEPTSFGRATAEEIYTPLAISILLIGVSVSLQTFGIIDAQSLLGNAVATALTVLWARAATRIGTRWLEIANGSGNDYEFAPIFQNFWKIGMVAVAALVIVGIWNLRVTPFLASAGVLGIVVGFAAQDAIGNLIGGVALYFDNTYKPGDVIVLEQGIRGTVIDIGIRSTSVLTPENTMVTVPNSVLNSTQVVNQTAPRRHIRVDVPISAAYGTDYETVERIAMAVCEETPMIRESPRPRLLFNQFGDSALVFELQAYVAHPLAEIRAVDQLNRRIYDRFNEEGITIPFPQRELSFLENESEAKRHLGFREGDESTAEPDGAADRGDDPTESPPSGARTDR
ncbi:mechanosensitive ion channel family protein [Natronococcus jeotgali]|uniref:Small-conductance mechanosensitive channel n=1 Tax=Natronococcus jeotgali DSM 18795 TaxID=1227498 RepID=L9XVG9_9EURY|nr:mechanosensitive ion channel family protein [Natronococcus jeotgali]ELY64608.1 small-conductance mechanosensitive channel [Natronococcus jeotgali DSM 18795]